MQREIKGELRRKKRDGRRAEEGWKQQGRGSGGLI